MLSRRKVFLRHIHAVRQGLLSVYLSAKDFHEATKNAAAHPVDREALRYCRPTRRGHGIKSPSLKENDRCPKQRICIAVR